MGVFYGGEKYQASCFRWKERGLIDGKQNKMKNVFFVELCFFIIVLNFPRSVPFSLYSPGISNQVTAGEKRNPNWHRYKEHFTNLDLTSAAYPTTFCDTSRYTTTVILTLPQT